MDLIHASTLILSLAVIAVLYLHADHKAKIKLGKWLLVQGRVGLRSHRFRELELEKEWKLMGKQFPDSKPRVQEQETAQENTPVRSQVLNRKLVEYGQ